MRKVIIAFMAMAIIIGVVSTPVIAETTDYNKREINTSSIIKIDGKQTAYNLLHTNVVELCNEEDIIKLYYRIYLDQEATDWDIEFWKQRITKEDTTLLTYGMINSNSFEQRCDDLGLIYDDYFIEEGVFNEGICPLSEECGLTPYGDYVFYATFGNSTYYHVVEGAEANIK